MSDSLKTDKTIDKHLHMLKTESGEISSLSVSTEGNGAKVTGDLVVTGGTSINGNASIKGSVTSIKGSLEVVGKIQPLNSITMDGRVIYFDGGEHTYITESADDILDIYVGSINMLRLDEANGNIDIKTDNIRVLSESGGTYAGTDDTSLQTKAQINSAIVQTAEVTISEAEMNALHTTEKELIAAQGSGKVIIPLHMTVFADRDASTAQSIAATMWIAYDGETTTGNVGYFKRFMRLEGGDRVLTWFKTNATENAQSLTGIDNVPLTAKLDLAITSGSIDSCKCVIQYYVYDNS